MSEIPASPWQQTILSLLIRIQLFHQTSTTNLAIHLQIVTLIEDKEDLPVTKDMLALALIKMDPKEVFVFQEVLIAILIAIVTKADMKMSQTSTDAMLVIAFLSTVPSPRIARTKICSVFDQTTRHSVRRAASPLEDPASVFSLGTTTETSNTTATTNAEDAKRYWVDD